MDKPIKLTQQQLAEEYSVSTATLRRARENGIDVQNRDEFADYILNTKAKRPHAWINGVPWEQDEDNNSTDAASAEMRILRNQVREAPNYDVARTLKTQIDSLMQIRKIEILEGDYIHKDEVENDYTRIGSAMQAGLKQMAADLPAMIEGLSAAQSKKVLIKATLQLMSSLSDEAGKLYQQ
jgi:hypothetical protein